MVKTIDRLMSVPGAADVGEFADGRIKFIGVYLDKDARLVGVRLSDLPEKTEGKRLLLAAIVRDEELIIPRGKDRLLAGDLVYFIARLISFQIPLLFLINILSLCVAFLLWEGDE